MIIGINNIINTNNCVKYKKDEQKSNINVKVTNHLINNNQNYDTVSFSGPEKFGKKVKDKLLKAGKKVANNINNGVNNHTQEILTNSDNKACESSVNTGIKQLSEELKISATKEKVAQEPVNTINKILVKRNRNDLAQDNLENKSLEKKIKIKNDSTNNSIMQLKNNTDTIENINENKISVKRNRNDLTQDNLENKSLEKKLKLKMIQQIIL